MTTLKGMCYGADWLKSTWALMANRKVLKSTSLLNFVNKTAKYKQKVNNVYPLITLYRPIVLNANGCQDFCGTKLFSNKDA